MTGNFKLLFCAALFSGAISAQPPQTTGSPVAPFDQPGESAGENTGAAPVAFVYMSRPTHIDGFAAAANGKLTPVPGSPFANIAVTHMSVNKSYLFGVGTGADVYTFSIAANGSLKLVATTNVFKNERNCAEGPGRSSIDYTGSTLYIPLSCSNGYHLQSYRIEPNGDLQYLGSSLSQLGAVPPIFLGTNKYAYVVEFGCGPANNALSATYSRESNELLTVSGTDAVPMPPDPASGVFYCPSFVMAGDPTNHLALVVQTSSSGEGLDGPPVIATYTADAHGNLTTRSTQANMIFTQQESDIEGLSISPSGKFIAVGGTGFQVFHFNGGEPVSDGSSLIEPDELWGDFAWDRSDHLYAITFDNGLFVYNVTANGVEPAAGSPYLIPEAGSVIVLSK
jgi:hypothetical protein